MTPHELAKKICRDNNWNPGSPIPSFSIFFDQLEKSLTEALGEATKEARNTEEQFMTLLAQHKAAAYEECAKIVENCRTLVIERGSSITHEIAEVIRRRAGELK